jgi:replication protein O
MKQATSQQEFTAIPNSLLDFELAELSDAEWKVYCYIMRRTLGFHKDSDSISLDQFCHGMKTDDGKILNRGTGLARPTIVAALESLQGKGKIIIERGHGRRPNRYSLATCSSSRTEPLRSQVRERSSSNAEPLHEPAVPRSSSVDTSVAVQLASRSSSAAELTKETDKTNIQKKRTQSITCTASAKIAEDGAGSLAAQGQKQSRTKAVSRTDRLRDFIASQGFECSEEFAQLVRAASGFAADQTIIERLKQILETVNGTDKEPRNVAWFLTTIGNIHFANGTDFNEAKRKTIAYPNATHCRHGKPDGECVQCNPSALDDRAMDAF